ncbi:MAG: tRNA (guanosine(37)-N1)-methyltransferase TrmD [Phycisphaeraceae bacterium]|nr:tRNA (guanosine(37)-N1)-methyltransferase TrmD [Phycisphaeraceae bacterium]
MPLRFDILTTFPEIFAAQSPAALGLSIPARARESGLVEWHAHNIRDYATDKHQKTDDRPFGGGPGMVMTCQPLWDAVHAVEAMDPRPASRILLTPQGRPLTQAIVEDLAAKPRLLLIAGHYEGIDERVIEKLAPLELSLGDYILSGGELAAMVLMDAIIRLLPGALGHESSANSDSFSAVTPPQPRPTSKSNPNPQPNPPVRLLDCPHYTRPREWMGMTVPDVLISGNHQEVAKWRLEQMLKRTRDRRPDLLKDMSTPPPSQ